MYEGSGGGEEGQRAYSHSGPLQVGVLGLTSQSAAGRATGDAELAEKDNTGSG